jgi:hypothetical protein
MYGNHNTVHAPPVGSTRPLATGGLEYEAPGARCEFDGEPCHAAAKRLSASFEQHSDTKDPTGLQPVGPFALIAAASKIVLC